MALVATAPIDKIVIKPIVKQRRDKKGALREDVYDFKGVVGEGTYGVVYKAERKSRRIVDAKVDGLEDEEPETSTVVAMKQFKATAHADGVPLSAIREIMLLKELRHENVITLLDVVCDLPTNTTYLAFEYVDHDLAMVIEHHRKKSEQIRPHSLKSFFWQLLNGLNFLHQNWVIHRDVKPNNVLIGGEEPNNGKIKITDFGMARIYQAPVTPLSQNTPVVVTLWYRPPELLLGAEHYTKAVDMWAAGCIFAELMILRPLFEGVQVDGGPHVLQESQIQNIFKMLGTPTLANWPDVAHLRQWEAVRKWKPYVGNHLAKVVVLEQYSKAYDLLSKLLVYDPAKRLTAHDALNHPYFTEAPPPSNNAFDPSCTYRKRGFIVPKGDDGKAKSTAKKRPGSPTEGRPPKRPKVG